MCFRPIVVVVVVVIIIEWGLDRGVYEHILGSKGKFSHIAPRANCICTIYTCLSAMRRRMNW